MQEISNKEIRMVEIEEFFFKENDIIYWNWRFVGAPEWNRVQTAYKEIPWALFNLTKGI